MPLSDFYVYAWINLRNGKRYIGKGRDRRAHRHMRWALAGRTDCPVFYAAIRKHGEAAFRLEFLATGLDEWSAHVMEIDAICGFESKDRGYNCTLGGEGHHGRKQSAEERARRSAVGLGRPKTPAHRANLWATRSRVGKPRSEETRQKISLGNQGARTLSSAQIENACMLLRLGARLKEAAKWLGVNEQTLRVHTQARGVVLYRPRR
jgi:hypothetical protein